jgi:hypothetical protein
MIIFNNQLHAFVAMLKQTKLSILYLSISVYAKSNG